jgi:hypothetical protein
MERKRGLIARITRLIKDGETEEITKAFSEHRFEPDFLPATDMNELCEAITSAPNKSIAQLAIIIEERYNPSNIGQLLPDDGPPLILLAAHLDKLLSATETNRLRHFVIDELSNAVKAGITAVSRFKNSSTIESSVEP